MQTFWIRIADDVAARLPVLITLLIHTAMKQQTLADALP